MAGVVYFTFRVVATREGINPYIFWPLWGAEFFGFLTFLILAFEAWELPTTPRPKQLALKTTIFITSLNEDIDIVEPTIIGARAVRGDTEIWLLDDGRRPEMAKLCRDYGIFYHTRADNRDAKAGNVNSALPKISSELLLLLDADHVPAPDILEAMSGYFVEPDVALVQSAHSFRNHNSVMHEETGRHEQSLFFDVLLPGRNRLKSVFWCGSAALLRREALLEIGGVASQTSTEDFETSLLLQHRGYRAVYHNEHLIQGLAPDNLEAYLIQRFRWAQGTLSSFRPGYAIALSRKLSLSQRISYLGALLYYLTPLQRLVYSSYVVLVGFFGFLPISGVYAQFLSVWIPYMVITFTAVAALQRGSSQPFEGVRNTFLSLEVFLRAIPVLFRKKKPSFRVTPKNSVDLGGFESFKYLRLPLALISINVLVIVSRITDYVMIYYTGVGFLPELSIIATSAVTGFATLEVIIVGALAYRLFRRRQLRVLWRFPVRLEARIADFPATVVDLHQAGLGAHVSKEALGDQSVVPVKVALSRIDGQSVWASGELEVREVSELVNSPGTVRVGGVMTWTGEEDRTAVIEHCYVVEPYRARNRYWFRRSPRVPIFLPVKIGEHAGETLNLSYGGMGLRVYSRVNLVVGQQEKVQVLYHGKWITGSFIVRDSRDLPPDGTRVGGEVDWSETGWLNGILAMELKAAKRTRGVHAEMRR